PLAGPELPQIARRKPPVDLQQRAALERDQLGALAAEVARTDVAQAEHAGERRTDRGLGQPRLRELPACLEHLQVGRSLVAGAFADELLPREVRRALEVGLREIGRASCREGVVLAGGAAAVEP